MNGWEEKPIKEIYKSFYDGPHATPKPALSGKIFLRIENITDDGHLDFSKTRFISDEEYPRWTKRVKPKKEDIVFSYEATLGRYAIIPKNFEGCLGRRIALIRPDNSKGFYKFLYYYFFSNQWKIEVANYLTTGATVDRIPLIKFPQFKVFLPPLPIQKKIAAVLSAYDDLIENNNRRIAILEKMAEELYQEWFVRLRFPDHENTKIIKGIPEGWEVKKIGEIVNFLSGFSFKSKNYLSIGKYAIVTIKNVQAGYFVNKCTDFIDDLPSNMKFHCRLKTGDILMSLTGNVGRTCFVIGDYFLLNQRVANLKTKVKNSIQFVYYTFNNQSMTQLIENLSLGSTAQMNLSPIQLAKQKIIIPEQKILNSFEKILTPKNSEIILLLKSNEILKTSRDRLLSRLMAGKIDVGNLDIQFPFSMKEGERNE